MKFRTFFILTLFVSLLGCGESQTISQTETESKQAGSEDTAPPAKPNETSSVDIEIGMLKEAVSARLTELGATDISSGMQATAAAPKSDWMWALDSPKLSIETLFVNEKLATINVWDWQVREMTSYHHTMQYDQVDSLTIKSNDSFECHVIQTHNATGN